MKVDVRFGEEGGSVAGRFLGFKGKKEIMPRHGVRRNNKCGL